MTLSPNKNQISGPANSGPEAKGVTVRPEKELLSRWNKQFLAQRIKRLNMSALDTAEWLARLIYGEGLTLYDADGAEIPIYADTIEEAYHYDDEMGWNDDIKQSADKYPERRPRRTELLKYQLWDAALQLIEDPIGFEG